MEIVEKYLHAIEFWLPKSLKTDIIAELSEDIRSQIEEKQDQLGRSLSGAELESLVKQRGAPLLVANRYRPQHYLIGPILFPVYLFVLKICAFCYLLPACVIWIITWHVQHPESAWASALAYGLGTLWTGTFVCAGVITIVFAVLQSKETQLMGTWTPKMLPPLRNPNQIPRASSVFELVTYITAIIWWLNTAWSPDIFGVSLSFTPVWAFFFWGFLATQVLSTALSAMNLMRPYWTSWRAAFRLAIDSLGALLFCWLLKANVIATLTIAAVAPARSEQFRHAIQVWMERCFPYGVVFAVVLVGVDIYRLIRVSKLASSGHRQALALVTVLLLAFAVRA